MRISNEQTPLHKEKKIHPAQLLALSFIVAILVGTLLLSLPWSTTNGKISLIDALFTSTSAVCVTGLIVQDTPTYFSTFGQLVIMFLFQLGGLGIMSFSTLIMMVAGRKISIRDRLIIQEGYHPSLPKDVGVLIRSIFIYTFIVEGIASVFLYIRWHNQYPEAEAVFKSVFHAISAFCNAGFSLFSDSFMGFRGDVWVNLVLMASIFLGGIGFLVLQETWYSFNPFKKKKMKIFSLHAKMVLFMSLVLVIGSWGFFLAIEWNKSLADFSLKEKLLASLFQIITPRTAGFNTMDISGLSHTAVFLLILLMFIGASPGSTGGGIKTSTAGVILTFIKSRLTGRESVSLFHRTLPGELVIKAYTLTTLAICFIAFSTFMLFLTQPQAEMKEVFFEVFSAYGTVGLTLGLTPNLTGLGKLIIILTMYVGRIGPLTLLYVFSRKKTFGHYTYVEESVMIG